jgi:hypothetical protein
MAAPPEPALPSMLDMIGSGGAAVSTGGPTGRVNRRRLGRWSWHEADRHTGLLLRREIRPEHIRHQKQDVIVLMSNDFQRRTLTAF